MAEVAEVRLWGRRIGAVSLLDGERYASFQYKPEFVGSGIEVAPLMMPLRSRPYRFPGLDPDTFRGLPGMLADSLPDRFGNALIDGWLARQGRASDSFGAIERLCYIGVRGMGALEFAPPIGPAFDESTDIDVSQLVELAALALSDRSALSGSFADTKREQAVADLLRVGTSAGGARAKAVIAWNESTDVIRSGQVPAGPGFEDWLLKFDGVNDSDPTRLEAPRGYGAVEFAYSLMARAAGIDMPPTRVLEENGRRHFMVRRFDRDEHAKKLHMQSLGALAHLDFNQMDVHSYEQALLVIRRLGLRMVAVEQQFRRMVFNVVARNQDDHVKNIAFLMNPTGKWLLSPAFDVTHSYKPESRWVGRHQMSVNGKRDEFSLADFEAVSRTASMAAGKAEQIHAEVDATVRRWPDFASRAGVPDARAEAIGLTHRLGLG